MPKSKEEIFQQRKEYREQNKDKLREQKKAYYEANKEKIKEKKKEYRERKKEYLIEYRKNNRERIKNLNQKPENKKARTLNDWKRRGLICNDYDDLYDRYLASTNCENCDVEYGKMGDGTGKWRCMDHDHETGEFRNFLCNACNIRRK
jgi:phage-related protein